MMECRNPNGIYCYCCGKTHMTSLGKHLIRLMGRESAMKLIIEEDELEQIAKFTQRGKRFRGAA